MTSIPPLVSSVLQTPAAQGQQSRVQDTDENRRAAASRELAALDQHQTTEVENTDADSRVHADSGGQGSRGREFAQEKKEDEPSSLTDVDSGASTGPSRLDITV